MIVLGEAHLRWSLRYYGRNYNDVRTHHLWIKIRRLIARFGGPEALAKIRRLIARFGGPEALALSGSCCSTIVARQAEIN